MGSHLRKLTLRLGTLLLASFLAAEIGLRTLDSLRGRGWNSPERKQLIDGSCFTAPRLFCQFRPPPLARFPAHGSEIRINSLGLRGEEAARKKPEGTFRILCLGGSTTFDPYNGAGTNWPLLLQEKLRAQFPRRRVEVLNAGVNGWSSAHSLTYFLFDGLSLEPDLVIVHHNVNDLSVNFHGTPEPDYSNKYARPEWDPRPEAHTIALDGLLGWSQAYLFLRLKAFQLLPRLRLRQVEVKPYDEGLGLPAAVYFRRNLDSICAVASAHGVRVALGLQPEDILRRFDATLVTQLGLGGSLRVPSAEGLRRFHGEYLRIVREVAARWGAVLVDADQAMSGRAELFVDTCHTTAAGSEALAEVFRSAIAPLLAATPVSRAGPPGAP
jgi:lysophospholipase L1-like esterase